MKAKLNLERYKCLNKECKKFGKKNKGHIRYSHYKKGKHGKILYLRCVMCKGQFSENKGTIFYRKKTDRTTILKVLHSSVEGMGIKPAGRVYNKSKNTIKLWLREAGEQAKSVEDFF